MEQPEPQAVTYPTLINSILQGKIKIPQFQRDFVWSREKSAALLDSVLRGYPIGTFILWKTKETLRSIRNIGGAKLPETPDGESVDYVLDGQQRLTSLFAAIKGLTIKREDTKEDFAEIVLHLEAEDDDPIVVVCDNDLKSGSYVRIVDLVEKSFTFFSKFPSKYHERIEQAQTRLKSYLFSQILVKEAKIDIATEIFTRINEGGKPLSPFEIMVAKTYDAASGFDLAEKCDEINQKLRDVEYETIPEITFLQIASILMVKECRKKAILNLKKNDFIKMWPSAVEAAYRAIEHVRLKFGVPASRLLPYPALIIPLAYYFHRHPKPATGIQADRLRQLFWHTSAYGAYSASLESKVAQDIRRVDLILADKQPEFEEPWEIDADYVRDTGSFATGRSFIKTILCLLASKQPCGFEDGKLVLLDNDYLIQANSKNYHHFFPRAYLQKQGVETWMSNHIANITIVDAGSNKRMRDKAPATYLKAIKSGNKNIDQTMKSHLISLDRFGVWENDYEKFFNARCKAIASELAKCLTV